MKCLINKVEYKMESNFYFDEQSGNKTASSISVLIENQDIPQALDVVEIFDGEKPIFFGTCGIPKSPKYTTGLEKKVYSITCNCANAIMANRIVNEAYQQMKISNIVENLYNTYIIAENIALGNISDIPLEMVNYTASNMNLQEVLNELADLVGATWRITPDRKFYFLASEDFPRFPLIIDKNFKPIAEVQATTKDYNMRTVQYISGATDRTATQTESYIYDGEANSFVVGFPVAQKPTVYINDVLVPSGKVGINGIDDEAEGITFLFTYNSSTINYKTDTQALTSGDIVKFEYIGLFDITVRADNSVKIAEIAKQTGTSGLIEYVEVANNITNTADGLQLANSLLEEYSQPTTEVSMWLLSSELVKNGFSLSDLEVLTVVSFNLPDIDIVGDYVITERKLEPFFADMDNAEGKFKITLKLMNRNYLKSYGETISKLKKDISKLSIRESDTVVRSQNVIDKLNFKESVKYCDYDKNYVLYPTATITNGSLFSSFNLFGSTYYPRGGNNEVISVSDMMIYYPTTSTSIFIPNLETEVYPI